MRERAASGVLTRHPDVRPLEQQGAEGQRLPQRPVDLAVGHHLVALFELPGQLRVEHEAVGHGAHHGGQSGHRLGFDPGLHPRDREVGLDVGGQGQRGGRQDLGLGPGLVESGLQAGGEVVEGLLGLFQRDVAAAHQSLGVQLAHRALGVDEAVHEGLGVARIVPLVVAVLAVADHVDDDVLVEGLSEAEGQPGGAGTGLGIVPVHVEDGSLHHLGHVRRVHRTAGRLGRRREAQLVVDDHVHRATGAVAGQTGTG